MENRILLNITEAAQLLGMTKVKLYNLTRPRTQLAAPVPYIKLGKNLMFRRDALEAWVAGLEVAQ
jgi:predicted DNA-binding transcriptional regulator AlpA